MLLFLALFAGCSWRLVPSISSSFETSHPDTMATPAGNLIRTLTPPGPTLEVWGAYGALYVQAGRPPALRDATIGTEFVSDPVGEYYRRRFLREMRQYRPSMFVDARKLSCCFIADPANRFELVPAIKAYIDSNYIQVGDRWDLRFFRRRDLAGVGSGSGCWADAWFVPLSPQEESAVVFGNGGPEGGLAGARPAPRAEGQPFHRDSGEVRYHRPGREAAGGNGTTQPHVRRSGANRPGFGGWGPRFSGCHRVVSDSRPGRQAGVRWPVIRPGVPLVLALAAGARPFDTLNFARRERIIG